jgi:uncharacterized membrane protein
MLNRTRFLLAVICVLYIAARMWRLGDSCLWFDEIFSVHAAEHSWNRLWWFVARDLIHPPLFYVVLKCWISMGGESVFWLRLLPVVFSVLALVPFVRLCRELKLKTPVILLSLFLLATNGALIKYTQTLRMYSMLMFMALLSMWLFARYFNRGKSFVPLLITNILLVYTHYFGWLVIGTEIVALLMFQRIKWRRGLAMVGIVFAAFVPWMMAVWQAARSGSDLAQNIAWQTRPGLRELLTFVIDLVEPFYFQASNAEPASIYIVSTPLLLVVTAAVGVYAMEWSSEDRSHSLYLLLLFVALPFFVAFAASWVLPHSVWGTRHLIILLPPAIALISHTIVDSKVRPFRITAVVSVIGLSILAFAINLRREMPRHVWCGWNDVAADIAARPDISTIYAFENLVGYHLWFALRDSDRSRVAIVKGVDVATDDETYFLPREFNDVKQVSIDTIQDQQIWLAFRTSKPGDEAPVLDTFKRQGYQQCPGVRTMQFGATTVFWMKMTRISERCE